MDKEYYVVVEVHYKHGGGIELSVYGAFETEKDATKYADAEKESWPENNYVVVPVEEPINWQNTSKLLK